MGYFFNQLKEAVKRERAKPVKPTFAVAMKGLITLAITLAKMLALMIGSSGALHRAHKAIAAAEKIDADRQAERLDRIRNPDKYTKPAEPKPGGLV